jgi:hypothetical protein
VTDPTPERQMAFVLTDRPLPIAVAAVEDERTPEGMACLATILNGRLVARCVVPAEALDFFEEYGLFRQPVALALAAHEEAPGIQGRLFALVDLPTGALEADQEDDAAEPWSASVPSSNFDRVVRSSPGEERQAAVLLGHIVRFDRDRKHLGNLPLEAADILASIVSGEVSEVVDKVLGDLLGGATPSEDR